MAPDTPRTQKFQTTIRARAACFRTRTGAQTLLTVAALLLGAGLARAQTIPNPLGEGTTLMDVIDRFVDYALVLLTPLSVIMVLLTGYFYMTAGGNEEKVKRAHKTLIWTVIGIAIVLLAKSAQLIIKQTLGVS